MTTKEKLTPERATRPAAEFIATEWEACSIAYGNEPTDHQWKEWLRGLHSVNAKSVLSEKR